MPVDSRNKLFQYGSDTEARAALDTDNRNAPTGGKHSQSNPLPQSHVRWKSCRFHTLVCFPSPLFYARPPAGTSHEMDAPGEGSAYQKLVSKVISAMWGVLQNGPPCWAMWGAVQNRSESNRLQIAS